MSRPGQRTVAFERLAPIKVKIKVRGPGDEGVSPVTDLAPNVGPRFQIRIKLIRTVFVLCGFVNICFVCCICIYITHNHFLSLRLN